MQGGQQFGFQCVGDSDDTTFVKFNHNNYLPKVPQNGADTTIKDSKPYAQYWKIINDPKNLKPVGVKESSNIGIIIIVVVVLLLGIIISGVVFYKYRQHKKNNEFIEQVEEERHHHHHRD